MKRCGMKKDEALSLWGVQESMVYSDTDGEWKKKTFFRPVLNIKPGTYIENVRIQEPKFCGLGNYYNYGPNAAADAVVLHRVLSKDKKYPYYSWEVAVLKRADFNQWALPGGMVDASDGKAINAARREFIEEMLNNFKDEVKESKATKTDEEIEAEKRKIEERLKKSLFRQPIDVYSGIVYNDPRMTRNAWPYTNAYLFIATDDIRKELKFTRNENEALKAKWKDVEYFLEESSAKLDMFAFHATILKMAVNIANTKYSDAHNGKTGYRARTFKSINGVNTWTF